MARRPRGAAPAPAPAPAPSPATRKRTRQDTSNAEQHTPAKKARAAAMSSASKGTPKDRKGKGKAPAQDDEPAPSEYDHALFSKQSQLLTILRASLTCTICYSTFDLPYSLACGHIFCRKCLLVWFHRPDPLNLDGDAEEGESSGDSSGSDESDAVIVPEAEVIELGSDEGSSVEEVIQRSPGRAPHSAGPMREQTHESSEESESSEEEEAPASTGRRNGPTSTIRGTLGSRSFTIKNADEATWSAVERAMYAMADDLASGAGVAPEASTSRQLRIGESSNAEDTRAARLARFAGGPRPAPPSSIASTRRAPPSSVASTRASIRAPPRRRNPSVEIVNEAPAPAEPAPIPEGQHRIKNLVCPHCRAACQSAPFRVFAISDMAVLLRAAEADDVFSAGSPSAPPSVATGAPLRGILESDFSWGGLFDVLGVETNRQRRERQAVTMRDNDDGGVRRCGTCNWEVNERSGLCEGCGREWNLSDGSSVASQDSFEGDGFPLANGYVDEEARSEDSRSEDSEDGFIVESEAEAEASGTESIELERARATNRGRRGRNGRGNAVVESSEEDNVDSDEVQVGSVSSDDDTEQGKGDEEEEEEEQPRSRRRRVIVDDSD